MAGTLLLPDGSGDLELKCGPDADITAHFKGLQPPTRYGQNFLTYVLWAITPERKTINLGELIADDSNRSKLQAHAPGEMFGFIATAEPYFAVRAPSNVVVLETRLPITAPVRTVTLPERQAYTYNVFSGRFLSLNVAKPVSLNEYHTIVALYEAQSAVAVARAAGAEQHAKEQFDRAEFLLNNAERSRKQGAARAMVLQILHEATETAENARAAAEQERARLARVAAEQERARLAKIAAEQERARQARLAAQQEQARQARLAADQESARQARLAAEQQQAKLQQRRRTAQRARRRSAPASRNQSKGAPAKTKQVARAAQ